MQPMRFLRDWLEENANNEHCLFSLSDLRSLLPDMSDTAFKTLLSRAVHAGHLL